MTNIDSEGGLGIDLETTQWTPLYFTSEEEAKKGIIRCGTDIRYRKNIAGIVRTREAIPVYFTENGKAIYHEADKDRFVIFVLRQEEA